MVLERAGQEPSGQARRWILLAYWIWIFTLTHWPGLDDLVPKAQWLPHADKIAHFSMYAGWMAAWWWVLIRRRSRVRAGTWAWLMVGGAAYGLFDELTQVIVSRDFEMLDWLADIAGLTAAMAVLMVWQRRGGDQAERR